MSKRIVAIFGILVVLLMVSPAFVGAACVESPSGLVSWWPGEGNANDVKGTNQGTSHGETFIPGEVGSAFSFNGADSYVQVNDSSSLDMTDAITIEAWIKPDAYDPIEGQSVVTKLGGRTAERSYTMFLASDGKLYFGTVNSAGAGGKWIPGPVIPLNQWAHVAGVKDAGSTSARIYVNGALAASGTVEHPIYKSAASIGIGTFVQGFDAWPNEGFFHGAIDEVSIYNRALTQSEIQSIFNAGSDGKCKSLPIATPTPTLTSTQIAPTSQTDQQIKDLQEQVKKLKEQQARQERKISWLESILNSLRGFFGAIFGWKVPEPVYATPTPTAIATSTSVTTPTPVKTPKPTVVPTMPAAITAAPTETPIPTPTPTPNPVLFYDDFSGGYQQGVNWAPMEGTPKLEPIIGNPAPSLKFSGVLWNVPVTYTPGMQDGPAAPPAGPNTIRIRSAVNPFNSKSGFTVSADIVVTPGTGTFTFTVQDQNNPQYNYAQVNINPGQNGNIKYTIPSVTGRKDPLPYGVSNPFLVDTKFHTFTLTVDDKGNAKWLRDGVVQASRTGFVAADYVIEFRSFTNSNRPYWDYAGSSSSSSTNQGTASTYDTGDGGAGGWIEGAVDTASLTAQDFYVDNVKVT